MDSITFTHEDFMELAQLVFTAQRSDASYYSLFNKTDFIEELYKKVSSLATFTVYDDCSLTVSLDWVNRRFD